MKRKKIAAIVLALFIAFGVMSGCKSPDSSDGNGGIDNNYFPAAGEIDKDFGDSFSEIAERGFTETKGDGVSSSFSLSASRAAYVYMRRSVKSGRLPSADSVRIEEYINYFRYDLAPPDDGDFSVYSNVFDCPWNEQNKLLRVTLCSRDVERGAAGNNTVFLTDVSASMYGEDRLGLFKTAFTYAMEGMGENDTVSLVTYAGESKTVFEGCDYSCRDKMLSALDGITAGGNTAGGSAISHAYAIAEKYFRNGGNNRIILFTDGDFNVGVSDTDALAELVSGKKEKGIALSCVGVGYGNYRDDKLETLSAAGDGETYYLDSADEARRVFGREIAGVMLGVARDAKAQVVFAPEQVAKYRLIGYDNRMLSGVQFEDPSTDAGEIGANRQITALYEIIPADTCSDSAPAATVELRYRPVTDEGRADETSVLNSVFFGEENGDDGFIACVAEYGLLLRNSAYAANASFDSVLSRLATQNITDGDRAEFAELVRSAKKLKSYL